MKYLKLEDEIDDIQEISDIRDSLSKMLCMGMVELARSFDAPRAEWNSRDSEPQDLIFPSLLRIIATRRFNHYLIDSIKKAEGYNSGLESRHLIFKESQSHFEKINLYDNNALQKTILGGESPDKAYATQAPLFQCVKILQAVVAGEKIVPPTGFLCSYYAVIKELTEVAPPFWSMGTARARNNAPQTAFMTGECAKALNSVARAIDSVATQTKMLSGLVVNLCAIHRNPILDNRWVKAESRRLLMEFKVANFWEEKRAITNLIPENLMKVISDVLTSASTCGAVLRNDILDLANAIRIHLNDVQAKVQKLFNVEQNAILLFASEKRANLRKRCKEAMLANNHQRFVDAKNDKWSFDLTHKIALSAVKQTDKYIKGLKEFQKSIDSCIDLVNRNVAPDPCKISTLPEEFARASNSFAMICEDLGNAVRSNLEPSKSFLEAVLDREIAAERTDRVNPTELVFAASALIELNPTIHDERYEMAVTIASGWITGDGLLDSYSYLDTNKDGYCLVLLGSEVLKALAQIIERIQCPLDVGLVKRIASYFNRMSVRDKSTGGVIGWCHDFPRIPGQPQRWTSCIALLALEFAVRAFSRQLNRRIAKHFTTTRAGEGNTGLDKLVYTDYGLQQESDLFQGNPEAQNQSVAFFMQRMFAHLQGLSPEDLGEEYSDAPCFSMILFGPPGTGKTTLIDALSVSSKCDKIEVTPSDILQEGEAFVERRAKLVFRALSMLTNTVILFDEFDSLLKRRSDKPDQTVYSFITPGLLPKLSMLYKQSRFRRNTYALATNRVGTLDDAAIRSERFDYKIGVYPPDAISRHGIICRAFFKRAVEDITKTDKGEIDVLRAISLLSAKKDDICFLVNKLGGVGMVRLKGELIKWGKNPKKKSIQYFLENEDVLENRTLNTYPQDDSPDRMYKVDGVQEGYEPLVWVSEKRQWIYSNEGYISVT